MAYLVVIIIVFVFHHSDLSPMTWMSSFLNRFKIFLALILYSNCYDNFIKQMLTKKDLARFWDLAQNLPLYTRNVTVGKNLLPGFGT